MAGAKPMSSNGEQVANDVVDREESLGVCHRFEAPHVALAPCLRDVDTREQERQVRGAYLHGPVWTIPDIKRGRLTEEALSAAGALWSPL